MFKEMGQIMGLMRNLPKMQASMQEMQAKLALVSVEGASGGGLVTAKVNGRMEVTGLTISDEAMKLNDRDMLADLVVAAVNVALTKAREQVAQESSRMAQELGLPIPAGGLPGFPS